MARQTEANLDLQTLIDTVDNSTSADWQKLDIHPVRGWEHGQNQGGNYIAPLIFDSVAVYRPDIDITLAIGSTVVEDFAEPWVQTFAAQNASSVAVWLRYRGVPVQEWVCVVVDGGRYLVPLPRPVANGYQVTQADMPRARLLFDLYGAGGAHQDVDSALAHAGVTIV